MEAAALWRVRAEDAAGPGRAVEYQRLVQAIADGVLGEAIQVKGPGDAGWGLLGEHPILAEHLPPRPLLRDRRHEEAEMDMTPMIDVTFQLLIFFMITASFIVQKTLDMPPLESKDATPPTTTLSELREDNVMVVVRADGSVTVDDRPTPLADLETTLANAVRGRDNVELVMDVEDDAAHDAVVQVLDAAGGAQIERVLFVQRVEARAPPGKTAPPEK